MGPGWLSHEARASLLGDELSLPLSCGKQGLMETQRDVPHWSGLHGSRAHGMGAQVGVSCCTPQVICALTTETL